MSSSLPLGNLCHDVLRLGSGELVSRLANIAIVILLGHRYGVVVLGVYALAQSATQYLQPLIDFGARHVGARLVARYPQAARAIIGRVQRRRFAMAGAVLPLLLIYSLRARLPGDLRLFLFAFSATGALYAASLDWAAWGQQQLRLVGWAKAIVPLCILLLIVPGRPAADVVLWRAAMGNACGFLLQSAVFWIWWRRRRLPAGNAVAPDAVGELLAWGRVGVMGVAWLCNLAFNTIDVLMLGWMSSPREVGLYSAAYRVLNQVLATYYLLTQVLYPQFARQEREERASMLRAGILLPLLAGGIIIATILSLFRGTILTVLFGREFLAAGSLLLLLSWSIPLDFLTSYLSNAFIAWGMERKMLVCTLIAAASNIALNRWLIPGFGARAAAANTVASYAILLLSLWVAGRNAQELHLRRESQLELSPSPAEGFRCSQP